MSDEYDWTRDAEWGVTDEEALADLRKRAASERDISRTRRPVAALGGSPQIVAQWRCLAAGCTTFVGVTEDAVHALDVCNTELTRRGEQPIAPAAFCEAHESLRAEIRANKQADRRSDMAGLIRSLKASADPAAEAALLAKLRRAGHPDVEGLVGALTTRPGKRKGSL